MDLKVIMIGRKMAERTGTNMRTPWSAELTHTEVVFCLTVVRLATVGLVELSRQ